VRGVYLKVRGKGELCVVACFVTRGLLLRFVCYSLNGCLKIRGRYAQTVYSIS
jgi:hypothetical protein